MIFHSLMTIIQYIIRKSIAEGHNGSYSYAGQLSMFNDRTNYFHTIKSNDEDNSILLRFIEREAAAESFLTRIDCLPPPNFDREIKE